MIDRYWPQGRRLELKFRLDLNFQHRGGVLRDLATKIELSLAGWAIYYKVVLALKFVPIFFCGLTLLGITEILEIRFLCAQVAIHHVLFQVRLHYSVGVSPAERKVVGLAGLIIFEGPAQGCETTNVLPFRMPMQKADIFLLLQVFSVVLPLEFAV